MVFVNKHGKQVGKQVTCFDCWGNHYRGDPECPNSKVIQHAACLMLFTTASAALLEAQPAPDPIADKTWILLDNQSSVHPWFKTLKLLV